jgi:NADH:ubiquinone oxidoreductase subunit C
MSNEDLKIILSEWQPSCTYEEGGEWLNVYTDNWLDLALKLRQHPDLCFDYLFCLTCVDWKTHLTMVYHLESTKHHHTVVIKSKLDRNNPETETVSHIWKTAVFHEREVFELFGVKFLHHPDLRHLILPDEWEGYPLRKDYEDPVNMIKL